MECEGNKDVAGLLNARSDFTVTLRRDRREAHISKLRMKAISTDMIEEEKYGYLNDHAYTKEEVPFLCRCLEDLEQNKVVFGLVGLRKLLIQIQDYTLINQIFQANVVQTIIKRARDPSSLKMQVEAAWILANLSVGKSSHIAVLIKHGIISLIVELLKTQIMVLEQQVLWLAGNIAGSSENYMQALMSNGTLNEVVRIYSRSLNSGIKECCTWVICNICRVSKPVNEEIIKLVIPVIIENLLHNNEDHVLADCAWALSKLTVKSSLACSMLVKGKCIPTLFTLSNSESSHIVIACIRIFGNISIRLDTEINTLIQQKLLDYIQKLLYHKETLVRTETAWLLSNIAAGTEFQSKAVFESTSLIEKLCEMIYNDTLEVKIQVAWVLSNLNNHISNEAMYLLFQKIIQAFINLASCEFIPKAIEIGLQGIEVYFKLLSKLSVESDPENVVILRNILSLVYTLQANPSNVISQKVSRIIQTYLVKNEDVLFQ